MSMAQAEPVKGGRVVRVGWVRGWGGEGWLIAGVSAHHTPGISYLKFARRATETFLCTATQDAPGRTFWDALRERIDRPGDKVRTSLQIYPPRPEFALFSQPGNSMFCFLILIILSTESAGNESESGSKIARVAARFYLRYLIIFR